MLTIKQYLSKFPDVLIELVERALAIVKRCVSSKLLGVNADKTEPVDFDKGNRIPPERLSEFRDS